MLTMIAYMVFWPAAIWNVAFWIAAFAQLINGTPIPRRRRRRVQLRNLRDSIVSLTLLFVPGLYLFGLY